MRRVVLTAALVALVALPSAASARVVELGAGAVPAAKSSCPANPCRAVYQVTGYQGRAGSLRNPFVVRRDGYLVAFTVTLPELAANQIESFNARFGGAPSVRLATVKHGTTRKTRLNHRLLRQSPVYEVERYLGSSPTFVLREPLRVRKGNIVAITVPTWLPALAADLGSGNWWRSSRLKGRCGTDEELSPPSAQEELREIVRWGCTYKGARLLYTATYVPDPRPTNTDED
ncbi:MAG TPA: hypothetical protein VFQ12_08375 [Thermoleophilaceae bacterium]|nr:hypothetical protein [Thermoleophilaceae bacterium]